MWTKISQVLGSVEHDLRSMCDIGFVLSALEIRLLKLRNELPASFLYDQRTKNDRNFPRIK
jgi:hypothetical protein